MACGSSVLIILYCMQSSIENVAYQRELALHLLKYVFAVNACSELSGSYTGCRNSGGALFLSPKQ